MNIKYHTIFTFFAFLCGAFVLAYFAPIGVNTAYADLYFVRDWCNGDDEWIEVKWDPVNYNFATPNYTLERDNGKQRQSFSTSGNFYQLKTEVSGRQTWRLFAHRSKLGTTETVYLGGDTFSVDSCGNVPPDSDFTYSTSGLSASFSQRASDDGSIRSFYWRFGDGDTTSAINPSHNYDESGTYSVTLTVTDDDGESDSETKSVFVNERPRCSINVSPNTVTVGDWVDIDFTCYNSKRTYLYDDGRYVLYQGESTDTTMTEPAGYKRDVKRTGSVPFCIKGRNNAGYEDTDCESVKSVPAPSANVYTNDGDNRVPYGSTVRVYNRCTNSTRAYLNGHYKAYNGTETTLTAYQDYRITSDTYFYGDCYNSAGERDRDTLPYVYVVPNPSGTIDVDPDNGGPRNVSIDYTCYNSLRAYLYQNGSYILYRGRSSDGTISVRDYIRPVSSDTTFKVICRNSESVDRSYTDFVNVVPNPTASLSVSPSRTHEGDTVTASFTCRNSYRAYIYQDGRYRAGWKRGSDGTLSSSYSTSVSSDTDFRLLCRNSVNKDANAYDDVDVVSDPSASINVSPNRAPQGSNVDIDYTCRNSIRAYLYQNGSYIHYNSRGSDGTITEPSGYSRPVSTDTTFRILCRNSMSRDDDATDRTTTYTTINAKNDYYSGQCGTSYNLNVDGNDSGSGISISSSGTSRYGGSTTNYGSYVRYNAPSGVEARDYFRYTIRDSYGNTDSAYAYIDLSCNTDPTADFSYSQSSDSFRVKFTQEASDPDGSISSYSWSFGDGGTSSAPNPSHTYSSAGTYTVSLKVTDNDGATDTRTKSTSVTQFNRGPTANNDSYTVWEDSTNNSFSVLDNDTDPDGDNLSVSSITSQPSNGSASISGNKILYTPDADYVGSDSFTYRASDGSETSNNATVSITVEAAEDYSLQVSPSQVGLSQSDHGTSDDVDVTIIRLNGFDGVVQLSIDEGSLDPELSDATFDFSDATLTGSETQSVLTVTVPDPIDVGSYPVRVRASSSELGNRYRSFTLTVESQTNPGFEEF